MKKIPCLIVDDEPLARTGLAEYVKDIDFLELKAVAGSALDANALISRYSIELMFLDIEMPVLSGLNLLKSLSNPPAVILTTAYPDYALDGFELDVIDYLLKPIAFPRLLKAARKAAEFLQHDKTPDATAGKDHFFIKINSGFEKVMYQDVLYIEALQNYVGIHLVGRKLLSYMPISALEKQLPPSQFMRTHKSYIVSLEKIKAIDGHHVIIMEHRLPISRRIMENLREKLLSNKLMRR